MDDYDAALRRSAKVVFEALRDGDFRRAGREGKPFLDAVEAWLIATEDPRYDAHTCTIHELADCCADFCGYMQAQEDSQTVH
jgi:hypothetical protein